MMDNIIAYSMSATETLCEMLRDDQFQPESIRNRLNPIIQFEVAWEFICFYVHLIDRYTMNSQDEQARSTLISILKDKTDEFLSSVDNKEMEHTLRDKIIQTLNLRLLARQDEYLKCKELMSEDWDKVTAFRKFGEKVSEILIQKNDEAYSGPCQSFVVESLKGLKFKQFVESIVRS